MDQELIRLLGFAILATLALATLFNQGFKFKILKFLNEGPKTAEEMGKHLDITKGHAAILLEVMEFNSQTVRLHHRSPWDAEGNPRPSQVYWITNAGKKALALEFGPEKQKEKP